MSDIILNQARDQSKKKGNVNVTKEIRYLEATKYLMQRRRNMQIKNKEGRQYKSRTKQPCKEKNGEKRNWEKNMNIN